MLPRCCLWLGSVIILSIRRIWWEFMGELGFRPFSLTLSLLVVRLFCLADPVAAQQGKGEGSKQPRQEQQENPAQQQEQPEKEAEETIPRLTQEIVVVGTRAQPRTVTESIVPIDVISSSDFVSQGDTDVADQLRTVLPSFNVNPQPVGDAARIVRPANLRGLAPDHTLILLNGKRRHRAAIITWIGNGVSDGAQGADLSVIPAIALRQVEVLRDGASAQYGSDAIAGVLNLQMKDDSSGGSLEVHTGGFSAGDGYTYTISGNVGLPLGQNGFANLSLEYGSTDPTSRSVQRSDAALLIAGGNTHVADPAHIHGSPEIDDDFKFLGNFGHVFRNMQIYGHTNYASKKVTGGFFFRNPNTRAAVFSADGGRTLLIGDLLDAQDGIPNGSANCPTVSVTNGVPNSEALSQVSRIRIASPSRSSSQAASRLSLAVTPPTRRW